MSGLEKYSIKVQLSNNGLENTSKISTNQNKTTHSHREMQTTATQTANRTSPYQTRSKTVADLMDENELLHAQHVKDSNARIAVLDTCVRLNARIEYPVIFRRERPR